MTHHVKFILITLVLLTLTTLVLGAHNGRAQRQFADLILNQGQERIVVTKTHFNPPLKMKTVRTKSRQIETDKEFTDDDEWLRGLKITLANASGKTVTFVGVELFFPRAEDQGAGFPGTWYLRHGTDPFSVGPEDIAKLPQVDPVLPGGSIEVALPDTEYNRIKDFLREIEFPDGIKRIEVRVITIGFSDGTAWNAGRMFRRDPHGATGPLRGWTLIERPEGEKPQVIQPTSSTRNRTAFFLREDASGFDSSGLWRFQKTGWRQPAALQTVEWGRFFDGAFLRSA